MKNASELWTIACVCAALVAVNALECDAQTRSSRRGSNKTPQIVVSISTVQGHRCLPDGASPDSKKEALLAGIVVPAGEVTGQIKGKPAASNVYVVVRDELETASTKKPRWRVHTPAAAVSGGDWSANGVRFTSTPGRRSRCELMAVVTNLPLRRGYVEQDTLELVALAKSRPVSVDYFAPRIRILRVADEPAHLNRPIAVNLQEDVEGEVQGVPDWVQVRLVVQPANTERRWPQLKHGDFQRADRWISSAGFGRKLPKDDYQPFDLYAVACDVRLPADSKNGITPGEWRKYKIFAESNHIRVVRKKVINKGIVSRVRILSIDGQSVDTTKLWGVSTDARITGTVDGRVTGSGYVWILAWDPKGRRGEYYLLGKVKPTNMYWEVKNARLPKLNMLKIVACVDDTGLLKKSLFVEGQSRGEQGRIINKESLLDQLQPSSGIVNVIPVDAYEILKPLSRPN